MTLTRGDTGGFDIRITRDGAAFDLTNCAVFFTAKSSVTLSDADAELIYSDADNIEIDPGTAGACQLTIGASDSGEMYPGDYLYDVQIKDGNGYIFTAASGILEITADVTRRTT